MAKTPRIDKIDKNYLINGHKQYFQRNVNAVNLTTSLAYVGPDRFQVSYLGTVTGTPQVQRSIVTPSDGASRYSQHFTAQRNASTLELIDSQKIESDFAIELINNVVSYNCQISSDTATQARITLRTPTVQDNYTTSTQIYTQTVNINADSTFHEVKFENITIPTSANLGLQVEIALLSPLGTDVAVTNHYITRCKLNIGKTAQKFSFMGSDFVGELGLCQRYFETTSVQGEPFSNGISADGVVSHQFQVAEFKTTKRSIPVISYLADASMTFFTPTISRFGVFGLYTGGFGRKYSWSADAEIN